MKVKLVLLVLLLANLACVDRVNYICFGGVIIMGLFTAAAFFAADRQAKREREYQQELKELLENPNRRSTT